MFSVCVNISIFIMSNSDRLFNLEYSGLRSTVGHFSKLNLDTLFLFGQSDQFIPRDSRNLYGLIVAKQNQRNARITIVVTTPEGE